MGASIPLSPSVRDGHDCPQYSVREAGLGSAKDPHNGSALIWSITASGHKGKTITGGTYGRKGLPMAWELKALQNVATTISHGLSCPWSHLKRSQSRWKGSSLEGDSNLLVGALSPPLPPIRPPPPPRGSGGQAPPGLCSSARASMDTLAGS